MWINNYGVIKIKFQQLRLDIKKGLIKVRVSQHARIEGRKDGLSGKDLEYVLMKGKVIEDYPDRNRCLLYAALVDNLPAHICLEYAESDPEIVIITAYVPDSAKWVNFQTRR